VSAAAPVDHLAEVRDRWAARWPEALALWSPFTRLRSPRWCLTPEDEAREGLTGSFAMIRLADQTVVIGVRQLTPELQRFPLEVLGHEIGHHILCPADLSDNARMLARIRRALPTVEHHAPRIANIYADLLINDRLQRARGLDMAGVYVALAAAEGGASDDRFWTFYQRIYEILWSLPSATLATGGRDAKLEGDAVLGARLVRSFASRWLEGAGRFGALCLPYLLQETEPEGGPIWQTWLDAAGAGAGGFPDGLTELDPDEAIPARHPALDPELNGEAGASDDAASAGPASEPAEPDAAANAPSAGQYREPFEYGQILAASGLHLTDHEVAVRYYRERARGHLIPFPSRENPSATDPLPEGVEPWSVADPLAEIDWVETVLRSPVVIPGVTTVRREWGSSVGAEPERVPVDLDLYVDSSGSMPNPQVTVSYLTLAGAIVALSALRAGARVQATLWSGTRELTTTRGFVRDEEAVLRVLTGFFGGGTAFPIHVVRDTYATRQPDAGPAHVLVVSDDGVTTMFDHDEQGRDGRDVINHALAQAGGGATMVLNLWGQIQNDPALQQAIVDGWDIHVVHDWADLVAFAAAFSRRAYGRDGAGSPTAGGARR
jgi:hypothetical protein